MRFLSAIVLSGCALVDASGDPHGELASGLSYESHNISNTSMDPKQALVIDLDNSGLNDVLVLGASGTPTFRCLNDDTGLNFECDPMATGPYDVMAVGTVGATQLAVGAATNKLDLLIPQQQGPLMVSSIVDVVDPADLGRVPVAIAIGTFAVGPAIVVAYENGPNLELIVNPTGVRTRVTAPLPTAALRTRMAVGDVRTGDLGQQELIVVQGTGTIAVYQDNPIRMAGLMNGGIVDHIVAGDFAAGPGDDIGYFVLQGDAAGGNHGEVVSGSMVGLGGNVFQFGQGIAADDLQAGLLDGDALPDIVALQHSGAGASLEVFLGVAGISDFPQVTIPLDDDNVQRFSLGDLNGDGRDDILFLPPKPGGGGVDYLLSR